ncbi:DUF255 domain-containing protein [Candidatus Poribacteria bacterium]|nr:DUF255 domain-containing protein [Candidatus Poribacteria bacterium]
MLSNLLQFRKVHAIFNCTLFLLRMGIIVSGLNGIVPAPSAHAATKQDADHALKNPDGTWKWTNRLIHETSPHLLMHAHNPVEWYTWGPEALERAKAEDKLIFLSVGYSTCYWCHLMEMEVFSKPEIAQLMNEWFINIKVDREERPDLDEIYMIAARVMTGSGGWPNSVFLTPDLLPFYAGTYFPPTDAPGRPGFPSVLQGIHDAWLEQRDEILEQARQITEVIRQTTTGNLNVASETPLDEKLITAAVKYLQANYDATRGGFGSSPKFPSPTSLEFLLDEYQQSASEQVLQMITHTLDMMAYGGIYDQIGGGFHRYSTDALWLVPRFEKMLYDNAQLAKVYLQAYQLTQDPLYRRVAEEIFAFISREMTSVVGGFYTAIGAEVDGVEGKYYVWTKAEIQQILGKKDAKLFMKVYGVDKGPNFEDETNVLYLPSPIANVAKKEKKSETEILDILEPLKAQLLAAREKRKRPLLDPKIITSWNGLMIDAFAYGYEVLGEPRYREAAQKGAEFILKHLRREDGQLMRAYTEGGVKYDGYLDDYAFLVRGLLGLYQATGEERWLKEARSLADTMMQLFWDDKDGGFYFTRAGQEDLIVRTKNPYDVALPSGNAVAVNNLLTLARLTGEKDYLDKAQSTLQGFTGMMAKSPNGSMHILLAANRYLATDWAKITASQPAGRNAPPALSLTPQFGEEGRKVEHNTIPAPPPLTPPMFGEKRVAEVAGINLFAPPEAPDGAGQALNGVSTVLPSGEDLVKFSASISSKGKVVSKSPFNVEVRLEIAEGWHINANPALMDMLIPTIVSVSPDLPVEVLSVRYPKGKSLRFDFSEQPISVYEGNITIQMKLKLKSGTSPKEVFPLGLELHYQACDDKRCLSPSTKTIQLALDASP